MPRTEAQIKASKKWVEANRELNIKRVSESIQRRYATDQDFRDKKRKTERERGRVKREERKAIALAAAAAATPIPPIRPQIQPLTIYGF